MNRFLVARLDCFRVALGVPVSISPDPDSLGRHDGPAGTSKHNIDKWGEVLAADVFIRGDVDPREVARLGAGMFNGFILYPDGELYGRKTLLAHCDVASRIYAAGRLRGSDGRHSTRTTLEQAINAAENYRARGLYK